MTFLHKLIFTLLHLTPDNVASLADYVGPWLYVVLFAIVFCETGLVVTPFLPGDSLLFTVGAVAAMQGAHVSTMLAIVLLCLAANCGDLLNYTIGYRVGPRVFSKSEGSRLLSHEHLLEAQRFYDRHGRKAIILARFIPIVRTFAPFVAGIGRMPFARFIGFSIAGGVVWVVAFILAGYYFGQIPAVKSRFHLVIAAVIVISILPPLLEMWRARARKPLELRATTTE